MQEPEPLNTYLGQMSPTHLLNQIKLDQFKQPNVTAGVDGKLLRVVEESKGSIDTSRPTSPMMIQEALRLPNISLRNAAESM